MRLGFNLAQPAGNQTDLKQGDLLNCGSAWIITPHWPDTGPLPPPGTTRHPATFGYLRPGLHTITCGGKGTVRFSGPDFPGGHADYAFTGAGETYRPALSTTAAIEVMVLVNDSITPLQDLRFYAPGALPGRTWHPDYLASLAPFSHLRGMDWLATNASPVATWASRNTFPGGDIEGLVDLCNTSHANPWINIPHRASAASGCTDYCASLGAYLAAHLDPTLAAVLEYTNETWNFAYPFAVQAAWCAEQGLLVTDPVAGHPIRNARSAYGYLADQAFRAVAAEIDPARGPRLLRVIAGQAADFGDTMTPIFASQPDFAPPWRIDAIACAPYADWADSSAGTAAALGALWSAGRTDEAIDMYCAGMRANFPMLATFLVPWRAAAAARGIPLLYYEGGTEPPSLWHSQPAMMLELATSGDPRIGQLERDYLAILAPGADAGCYFTHCFPGIWGVLQTLDDPHNARYEALAGYARDNNGTPGTRRARRFLGGLAPARHRP